MTRPPEEPPPPEEPGGRDDDWDLWDRVGEPPADGADAGPPPPDEADTQVIGVAPVGVRPHIDPEELSGLQDTDVAAKVRRVLPLQDEPSSLVTRYLFPTERFRGEWRKHIIHLATPLAIAAGATFVSGLVAGFFAREEGLRLLSTVAFVGWLAAMGNLVFRLLDWHYDRFILTNKRVMVVSGIITRNVAMMPLARVTDMKYTQTPLGRLLNYGTFVLESAGQDQALREVKHLPNPNELYLRVVEEMYEPAAVEARLGGVPEDDEDEEEQPLAR